jgi:fused signal recognition particle receptor
MRAILRDDPTMVSFFRRKKPDPAANVESPPATSRYSIEELAAAFPGAPAGAPSAEEAPAETQAPGPAA